jgi:4'-phosphopantetheinyl transferase
VHVIHRPVELRELLEHGCAPVASAHVHVFAMDTRSIAIDRYRRRLRALLSGAELKRHSAYHNQDDADVYICAHALKRLALSRVGGFSPEAWRFSSTNLGQPLVSAPASGLRLSVTHTLGLAACAITDGVPIGVDAECVDEQVDLSRSLQSFAKRERCRVRMLPESERTTAFFEHWTVREAYLKAIGLGLRKSMRSFSCDRCVGGAFSFAGFGDAKSWCAQTWRVGSHQLAIVIRKPSNEALLRVYNCIDM